LLPIFDKRLSFVYLSSLLSAVAAVHKQSFIHRDIKPSNFLFSTKTQIGVLVDFGLAQLAPDKKDKSIEYTTHSKRIGYFVDDSRLFFLT
jgi:serine/threonine protein kinase